MTTMRFKQLLICVPTLAILSATTQSAWSQAHQRAHIGLVYPISTNGIKAHVYSNAVSLHALSGVSGGETGVAISGLATIINGFQKGVAISGLLNTVSESAQGVQIAGLANIIGGDQSGAAISGLVNLSRNADGMAVAGLTNVAKENSPVQIAGLYNQSSSSHVQIAGLSNLSNKDADVQIAGLINKAHNTKSQVSGFLNVAKTVDGIQIAGFINIAEQSDYPIGFLNIIKKGERQIGFTFDEAGNAIACFRSGGRKTYGIIGAGYNTRMPHAPFAMEAGLGWHVNLSEQFRINFEIANTANTDFRDIAYYKSAFRSMIGWKIGKTLEIVAGPSFNYVNYLSGNESYTKYSLYDFYGMEATNSLFFGATAGLLLNL